MPRSCVFKVVKMVNLTLCVFYHAHKKRASLAARLRSDGQGGGEKGDRRARLMLIRSLGSDATTLMPPNRNSSTYK